MRNPIPQTLDRIPAHACASAREAVTKLVLASNKHCQTFRTAEEQLEYFVLAREWVQKNIDHIESMHALYVMPNAGALSAEMPESAEKAARA